MDTKKINDQQLIEKALAGHKKSLEELIIKHQDWIFNVAVSFVVDRDEAADLTQEVLIKMVTKLSTFKQESNFRTWLYRIVKNHFLNMQRGKHLPNPNFDLFGKSLDTIEPEAIAPGAYEVEEKILVQEAKLGCMKAMLLCLDPEQRLIFIMGELFEFPDSVGAEVMEISKANFRTRLHRARTQLYNFMDNKCGLVNKNNPCRCARKTVGFIKRGYVDPDNLQFQKEVMARIDEMVPEKLEAYSDKVLVEYQKLHRSHPFLKFPDSLESIKKLMDSKTIRETFNFQ